jgi:hypothetical protein
VRGLDLDRRVGPTVRGTRAARVAGDVAQLEAEPRHDLLWRVAMYCTQCGQQLPADARFCSACGAPVSEDARPSGSGSRTDAVEVTTAAIDIGTFDQSEHLEGVPELAPGTAMLVVVRGPNAGSRFLLDRDTTTIGRHPDSHMFFDDVTVSRRHAEVERRDEDFTVSDCGSMNGTYVNGDRVETRLLVSGDEVQVGRYKLLFVGAGHPS